MQARTIDNQHIIILEKEEELIETLTAYCGDQNIQAGIITGIGSTNDAILKYFNQDTKEYIAKKFSEKNFEIISLAGNVSFIQDKPFTHIHAVLSDENYTTFSGHLGSAIIGVTCEIIITAINDAWHRQYDDESKLNLIKFYN
ncbi:MAG: PPC domain-containing DNA-binding protein [Patescibacteria group bacterium]